MKGGRRFPELHRPSVQILRAFAAASLLSAIYAASATDLLVDNSHDTGGGSLRQAIADNESLGGGNTILFSNIVTGAITLASGELLVTKDVTILGPGAGTLALAGTSTNRVFHVSNSIVTISGLAITNGHASTNAVGGGIYNDHAALTLNNCTFSGNSASQGGGICSDGTDSTATLVAGDCTFSGNSAGEGGAIDNEGSTGSATLVVSNCTFIGNSASVDGGGGGAILNFGYAGTAALTVIASTFSSNFAVGRGGGIENVDATSTVVACTFSGNYSTPLGSPSGAGGAIHTAAIHGGSPFGSSTLSVTNSTFSGNSATRAGAIWISDSSATIIASTIISNSATYDQGVMNYGRLEIGSTILKPRASGSVPTIHSDSLVGGGTVSLGYNLSSDNGGGVLTNATDQINIDPLLGPLRDNGGPTRTHALLPGSPAIDKGKSFGMTKDQRGAPRPFEFAAITNATDGSDIGAFESGSPKLNIQQAGSAAMLSWPSYYGGFSLHSSTDLTSSNSWILAGGSPAVVGSQYQQTNGPISSNRFFRLFGN